MTTTTVPPRDVTPHDVVPGRVRARPVTPLGILSARLDRVVARLDTGAGADDAVRAELHALRDLAAGLDPYLDRSTSPESPALAELARRTAAHDWVGAAAAGTAPLEQEMLSGHVEGRLLRFLVRATRARRVLEIGMFTGYSALAMAEALPPGGEVVACEIDAAVAAFALSCFTASPSAEKITVRVGPALDTLRHLVDAGECFDLVFVDADKPSYWAYLDLVLDTGLLAPGGTVCVDNTLMQGLPWTTGDGPGGGPTTAGDARNGEAVATFNRRLAGDPRVEQVLVPLRDGLTLVQRVAE